MDRTRGGMNAGTAMPRTATKPAGTLTKRQARLKRVIASLIERNGRSPSYAEIADKLGIRPSAAYMQVMTLENKGHVKVVRGKARSIRVL